MIWRLLLVLGVVLGWAIWRLGSFDLPLPPPVVDAATVPEDIVSAPSSIAPKREPDGFQAVVERPLFRPNRRPFVPEPEPATATTPAPVETATPAPPPEPDWVLIGIGENAEGRVALLRLPERTELVRAREGDIIEGREVVAMSSNEVALRELKSGARIDLRLPERASD